MNKINHKFNIAVGFYTQSEVVPVVDGCIGFMFTNIGDTVASVNDMRIFPSATPATVLGDSRSVMAHEGDVYKGQLKLSFAFPSGALPQVEIVQLFYIDPDLSK